MNRLTRITAILIQLQSKKLVTSNELSEKFEVSQRTIYRDIRTLQDAGVPIGSTNGVGYFLVDGYSLPPIMINEEEANALVIAEKLISNQGDTSLKREFDSLLSKIKAILKTAQKEQFSVFERRVTPSSLKGSIPSNSLIAFQKAIVRNMVVDITYHAISKNKVSQREVEPKGLYYTNTAWVVIAYCRKRKSFREFRLDRIKRFKASMKTPVSEQSFDSSKYFSEKYSSS